MLGLEALDGFLKISQTERLGKLDCCVEGREGMEKASEVKSPPLVVGLAGVPYESGEDLVECKLSLNENF